jgi:ABC-type transport system involved in cytochrome bd biosynthesis fused ATPase/permease subunit
MDLEMYDKRLVTRNTRKGKLTLKDVDTMLAGLEDMADNVEEVPMDEHLLMNTTRDESRIKAADVSDEDAAALD